MGFVVAICNVVDPARRERRNQVLILSLLWFAPLKKANFQKTFLSQAIAHLPKVVAIYFTPLPVLHLVCLYTSSPKDLPWAKMSNMRGM